LLTGMTGISLHMQWPLTSLSHGHGDGLRIIFFVFRLFDPSIIGNAWNFIPVKGSNCLPNEWFRFGKPYLWEKYSYLPRYLLVKLHVSTETAVQIKVDFHVPTHNDAILFIKLVGKGLQPSNCQPLNDLVILKEKFRGFDPL
jgi:hypothetical protein